MKVTFVIGYIDDKTGKIVCDFNVTQNTNEEISLNSIKKLAFDFIKSWKNTLINDITKEINISIDNKKKLIDSVFDTIMDRITVLYAFDEYGNEVNIDRIKNTNEKYNFFIAQPILEYGSPLISCNLIDRSKVISGNDI